MIQWAKALATQPNDPEPPAPALSRIYGGRGTGREKGRERERKV